MENNEQGAGSHLSPSSQERKPLPGGPPGPDWADLLRQHGTLRPQPAHIDVRTRTGLPWYLFMWGMPS